MKYQYVMFVFIIISALAASASVCAAVQQSVWALHDHSSEWAHGHPAAASGGSKDDHLPFGKRSDSVSFLKSSHSTNDSLKPTCWQGFRYNSFDVKKM